LGRSLQGPYYAIFAPRTILVPLLSDYAVQTEEQFIHGTSEWPERESVLQIVSTRMLVVILIFAVVFLLRDVQVLAISDRAIFTRLAGYATLIVVSVAIMAGTGDAGPGILHAWTQRKFASVAVLVQLAELAAGFALRRFASGRYSWIGCVLPAPAFLVVLFALSFVVRGRFVAIDATASVQIVTAIWLALVGGIVMVLNWIDNPWEDRKFANDFALMTSCTALVFLPFSLF
jgi:hypothetical protein